MCSLRVENASNCSSLAMEGDFPLTQADGGGASGGPRACLSCHGGKLRGTVKLAVNAVRRGACRGGCHQGELAGASGVGQGWGRADGPELQWIIIRFSRSFVLLYNNIWSSYIFCT